MQRMLTVRFGGGGVCRSSTRLALDSIASTQVLMRVDLAVVAGLIPTTLVDPPVWYTPELNEALMEAMVS